MLNIMDSSSRVGRLEMFHHDDFVNESDFIKTLFIVISAVVANANSPEEIEDFAYYRKDWIRNTIYRDFTCLDIELLASLLGKARQGALADTVGRWLRSLAACCKESDSSMGEEAVVHSFTRSTGFVGFGSASISASQTSLVLQRHHDDAQNVNHDSFLENVISFFDVKDSIISINSDHACPVFAKRIVNDSGNYIININSKSKFYNDLVVIFNYGMTNNNIFDYSVSYHLGNNSYDVISFDIINDMFWVQESNTFDDAKSVIRVVLTTMDNGRMKTESRYYVSSVEVTPDQEDFFKKWFWGAGSEMSCLVDISAERSGEGLLRGKALENMAVLRKAVLEFFESEVSASHPFDSLRKKAAWDSEYLASVLAGKAANI